MRFMMIHFRKYENRETWLGPDFKEMEEMGKYNEELREARRAARARRLTPPATMSARVTFKDGKAKVTDGPFPETKEVVGGFWIIR